MGFLGSISVYLLRINMSVALVCMAMDPVDNNTASNDSVLRSDNPPAIPFGHPHQALVPVIGQVPSYETFARSWMGLSPFDEEETCPGNDDNDTIEVDLSFLANPVVTSHKFYYH